MHKCKWCENLVEKVSEKEKLCDYCRFEIFNLAKSRLRVISESYNIIKESSNLETIISRRKIMIDYLNEFIKYEQKGIEVYSISINDAINSTNFESNKRILELLTLKFEKSIQKINKSKTIKSKQNNASKFVKEAMIIKDNYFSFAENFDLCTQTAEELIKIVLSSN
ncbi:MAG: hypothetical protein RBR97_20220 [Bacteroidales bacterium]|nr:hypothetical protein [Bacteroidales bacterium]